MEIRGSITLLGMSNLGKTHWADPTKPDRLPSLGFEPFECDAEIGKRLSPWLSGQGYSGDITDMMAEWLGQPYDLRYYENARRYLEFENEAMQDVVKLLRMDKQPRVVSSTGSLYLVEEDIVQELRELTTFVLLDAPDGYEDVLFEGYMKKRKPVIWGDQFEMLRGERPNDALARSYRENLLPTRNVSYRKMAHKRLGYDWLRKPGRTAEEVLREIYMGRLCN